MSNSAFIRNVVQNTVNNHNFVFEIVKKYAIVRIFK